ADTESLCIATIGEEYGWRGKLSITTNCAFSVFTTISKDGDRDDARVCSYELGGVSEGSGGSVRWTPGARLSSHIPESGEHFARRSFQWQWDRMMKEHVGPLRPAPRSGEGRERRADMLMAQYLPRHRDARVTMHYRLKTERVPALGR